MGGGGGLILRLRAPRGPMEVLDAPGRAPCSVSTHVRCWQWAGLTGSIECGPETRRRRPEGPLRTGRGPAADRAGPLAAASGPDALGRSSADRHRRSTRRRPPASDAGSEGPGRRLGSKTTRPGARPWSLWSPLTSFQPSTQERIGAGEGGRHTARCRPCSVSTRACGLCVGAASGPDRPGVRVGRPSRTSESGIRVGRPSRASESDVRVGHPSRASESGI